MKSIILIIILSLFFGCTPKQNIKPHVVKNFGDPTILAIRKVMLTPHFDTVDLSLIGSSFEECNIMGDNTKYYIISGANTYQINPNTFIVVVGKNWCNVSGTSDDIVIIVKNGVANELVLNLNFNKGPYPPIIQIDSIIGNKIYFNITAWDKEDCHACPSLNVKLSKNVETNEEQILNIIKTPSE